MGHVSRNVGGICLTPKTVEQSGQCMSMSQNKTERSRADFLNKQLFTTPIWLSQTNKVYDRIGGTPLVTIGNIQDNALNRLFSTKYNE